MYRHILPITVICSRFRRNLLYAASQQTFQKNS